MKPLEKHMTGMEAVEKYFQLEQTDIVWQGDDFLVVHAKEAGFPAFYRLIWKKHVTEFSDLTAEERYRCVDALVVIEQVLREQLQPTKVNVASLGNQTPHLHWHVVARFDWDSHFPGSVWSAEQRTPCADKLSRVEGKISTVSKRITKCLEEKFQKNTPKKRNKLADLLIASHDPYLEFLKNLIPMSFLSSAWGLVYFKIQELDLIGCFILVMLPLMVLFSFVANISKFLSSIFVATADEFDEKANLLKNQGYSQRQLACKLLAMIWQEHKATFICLLLALASIQGSLVAVVVMSLESFVKLIA